MAAEIFPRLHSRGPIEMPALPAENDGMVIRGRVEKGVVVLEEQVSLPEGTEVTVLVRAASEEANQGALAAERRRVLAIMDAIAAMPIEGAGDLVNGADHDKALYSLECGGLPPLWKRTDAPRNEGPVE